MRREFWQMISGVMTPVPPPSWHGEGAAKVEWRVVRTECGCPHMIPDLGGTLEWNDGDVTDRSFQLQVTCPGPPVFWGCQTQLAGGEVAKVSLSPVPGNECSKVSSVAANVVAICTHVWPDGKPLGGWSVAQFKHAGSCMDPLVGRGFKGQGFFQRLVQKVVTNAGVELIRTETDYDTACLYVVEIRHKGASPFVDFAAPPIEHTDTKLVRRQMVPGGHKDYVQELSVPVVPKLETATTNRQKAESEFPNENAAYAHFLFFGTPQYTTAPSAPWDERTTISGWGAAGGPPPYQTSAGPQPSRYISSPATGGAVEVVAKVDARGSYSGNPTPKRVGIRIRQFTYDPATNTHSLLSTSGCIEITDTARRVDVEAAQGYSQYEFCDVAPAPGCPQPDFVCHPGLPPCPA